MMIWNLRTWEFFEGAKCFYVVLVIVKLKTWAVFVGEAEAEFWLLTHTGRRGRD
jgi:hypothetical protein